MIEMSNDVTFKQSKRVIIFSPVPTGIRRIVRILDMHITQYDACTIRLI